MRLLVIGRSRSGTTILRDVLSFPKNIHITNEMRIYNFAVQDESNYPRNLSSKVGGYNKLPFNVSPRIFDSVKDSLILSRVEHVERLVFKNKFSVFGDKSGIGNYILDLCKKGLDFKVVHIHRDGRDSVASGIKFSNDGKNHRAWARPDAFSGSQHWAAKLNLWFDIRKQLPTGSFIDIRFEDFITTPYKNSEKLSSFTGINVDEFKKAEDTLINKSKSNLGYFKKYMDWKKDFSPEGLEVLEKLKYI